MIIQMPCYCRSYLFFHFKIQALSALFPIAGARAANTTEENHSDYTSDYKG